MAGKVGASALAGVFRIGALAILRTSRLLIGAASNTRVLEASEDEVNGGSYG
jgi:hypothetical protein